MVNWYSILITILFALAGFFIEYFKTKQAVINKATEAIDKAEGTYKSIAKSGSQKREWAKKYVSGLIPTFLKPFITEDFIDMAIQTTFDLMASYATKQLDKITEKISDEEK